MRPNLDDIDNICTGALAHLAVFWIFSRLWGDWILLIGIFVVVAAAIKTLSEIKWMSDRWNRTMRLWRSFFEERWMYVGIGIKNLWDDPQRTGFPLGFKLPNVSSSHSRIFASYRGSEQRNRYAEDVCYVERGRNVCIRDKLAYQPGKVACLCNLSLRMTFAIPGDCRASHVG